MILYHCPYELVRAKEGDVGHDLKAQLERVFYIPPGGFAKIPVGLRLALPIGVEGQVRGRSGLAGRGILAHLGTIDAGYRGEISVVLFNHGADKFRVEHGDRVAQLVLAHVLIHERVDDPGHYINQVSPVSDFGRQDDQDYYFRSPIESEDLGWLKRVRTVEELGTSDRGTDGWGSTGT